MRMGCREPAKEVSNCLRTWTDCLMQTFMHTYVTDIGVKTVTCCAEEEAVPKAHPASCLGPQTAENALKSRLSYQQTYAQHWLDAAS